MKRLRLFPDPMLRAQAKSVDFKSKTTASIVRQMDIVMRSQKHGIGIAAPQLGISKRIAIVDVTSRVKGAERLVLINPKILFFEDKILVREGCMSIPDYTGQTTRFNKIEIRWQDISGKHRVKKASGIEAICIQHELDHLEGKLFIDRVSSMKRDLIPRRKSYGK